MNMHGAIAFLRGKKGVLANLAFQLATLASQALLIWSCHRFFSTSEFDDLFLTAAYITPVYTLLLFGGRQLVLSRKMSERRLLVFRTFGLAGLFLTGAAVIEFAPSIALRVIIAAFGWKIFEYLLDGFSVLCQHRYENGLLNALSLLRVLAFVIPFMLDETFFVPYLMTLTGLVCAAHLVMLRLPVRHACDEERLSINLPMQLGVVALLSALVVSIPRMVLGDSDQVRPGVLGFLGVYSYCYLGGQLVVSSIVPYAISKFRKIEQRQLVIGKIRVLVRYSLLGITLAFFAFGLGLYLAAPNIELLKDFQYLIPWATLIAPLALASNLIEPFSSLLDAERQVLVSVVVTLGVALVGSWFLAETANGVGYCIALASAFLVRALISGRMLLKGSSASFEAGAPRGGK